MPGTHTFYGGSNVLQPIGDIIGLQVDKVNLLLCQLISLPLAYLHYHMVISTRFSRTVRTTIPMTFGLIFCYFCFGNATKHLMLLVGLSYAIMCFSSPNIVHKSVFIFAMGYLIFLHWYRWYVSTSYYLDVTGPVMILVQKVTVLAFNLHDGRMKKNEELNDVQKREALRSLPDILSYLSYMFHFQAVLTGPFCLYTDYMIWINGTAAIGEGGKVEEPWRAVLIKLLQATVFITIYLFFGHYSANIIVDEKFVQANWVRWLFLLYFIMALHRVPYYYVWTFADAIYNLSGFGFNGYLNGKARWDLVSNVKPWKVEMALNFKETLEGWNCCTMYWLRRVAYDRAPKGYRTLSTYLLSAVWHGFFLGYYVTFLTGALFTVSARTVRRCLRWRFQGTEFLQRFYDILTFIMTKIAVSYAVVPFVLMHLSPSLYFYSHMYFLLHIAAVLVLLFLPRILRSQSKSAETETENDYLTKKL